MPKFTYISRDAGGQRLTAVAEAESRQVLLYQLKERGLTVVQITPLADRPAAEGPARRPGRRAWRPSWGAWGSVSTAELAVFWRELSTMVNAGLPIVEALESIAQELEHAKMRRVLNNVIAGMWEGFNLSQSIRRHPRIFSPMVVALISSAEESGALPEVTGQLATYLENRDRLIRRVRAALTYPIFLCAFFLVVMAVATFWLIPKFRDIYAGFNAKLPWLTERVFAINAFLLSHLAWLTIAGAGLLVGMLLWARTRTGREVIDRVMLRLPIFGTLLQWAAVARFCRSLSVLLAGGIPIARALEMVQETSGNSVVAKAIRESREAILQGGKIAASFKRQPIFPRMTIRMISAGEETGNLSGLLQKVSDFYESRVDTALTTINALIEPVMIIVIGGFVLLFVLAMYMPIFKLAGTMHA